MNNNRRMSQPAGRHLTYALPYVIWLIPLTCSGSSPIPRSRDGGNAPINMQAQPPVIRPALSRTAPLGLRWPSARYVAGVLLLAAAYYGAAKLGQTLRYTASVSAIWPPAGLGIAALYLWGMRWWPGVLIGECVVNGQLLLDDSTFPVGSLLGQQAGNMAEIVLGALLLRRLVGPNAGMDRLDQVRGMLIALGVAAAISATVGTVSMIAGGVIDESEATEFWRTWWLGDSSGGLVVVPLMLALARDPVGAARRLLTWEGGALIVAVTALTAVAFGAEEPIRYTVFPALVWAAMRFGPAGATLAVAISAVVAIGVTANDLGPFFKHPIDQSTLNTQLYIWVAALTTLFLSCVVSERERSSRELAEAHRTARARAVEQRRRIARDLHDSMSQALFSTVLHARTAQKALRQEGGDPSGRIGRSLDAIADLTRSVQSEMRSLLVELRRDPVHDGLVAALSRHASELSAPDGLAIDVSGPARRLPLSEDAESQLFAIGREALANIHKHAGASAAHVLVRAQQGQVVLEATDNGRGFNPAAGHPGHFGLESMRSRAAEIGGRLTIASTPGSGTVLRVRVPADADGN
jgi:signal transduction histidine kinase